MLVNSKEYARYRKLADMKADADCTEPQINAVDPPMTEEEIAEFWRSKAWSKKEFERVRSERAAARERGEEQEKPYERTSRWQTLAIMDIICPEPRVNAVDPPMTEEEIADFWRSKAWQKEEREKAKREGRKIYFDIPFDP